MHYRTYLAVLVLSGYSVCLAQDSAAQPQSLHDAAKAGDLAAVTKLLNDGTPVDTLDSENRTPLMLAAEGGKLDVVQYLLGRGASVYLSDKAGNFPLHHAAMCPDPGVASTLMQWQSSPYVTNRDGQTPSALATSLGHAETAQALTPQVVTEYGGVDDPLRRAEERIADANAILADLKASPEVASRLAPVQKTLRLEESAWMSRRFTNLSRLAHAVATQVDKEFSVVISFAAAGDANDVATAMRTVARDWDARFDFVGRRIREQLRYGPGGAGMPTRPTRVTRRRGGTGAAGQPPQPAPVDEAAQAMEQAMSAWVQAGTDNREQLCGEVKTAYLTDMMGVRDVASEAKAEKLTLLIDALMLQRARGLDRFAAQIRSRKERDAGMGTGFGTPTTTRRRRR